MDEQKNILSIPAAIIMAGVLIAFSIYISRDLAIDKVDTILNNAPDKIEPVTEADIKIREVTQNDHIRGSQSATVKLVEFSDTECPFCKMFHVTAKKVFDEYSKSNQIAWIYRHFPLDSLHKKARKESEALECAGELGGNDKFWVYLDRLMEITPSNDQLDPSKLIEIAEYTKLDKKVFETCLSSGKHAKRVQTDVDDAISAGGRGTPYSVIIASNGKKFPVDGALPYEALKAIIEQALKTKN